MPAEAWRFEDFELDSSAYNLHRNGEVVRLERIPFELLCLLVERRGELVTREEIIERVWGKGVFIDSENGINTAVRKIRRALNDDADAPRFVVTVPARGYRFVASLQETNGAAPVTNGRLGTSIRSATPAVQPIETPTPRLWWWVSAIAVGVGLAVSSTVVVLTPHRLMRSAAPAAGIHPAQTPSLPLPDKPSIAVLPFTNMSGDPRQEYFSDGLTDGLITSLSALPGLFVIARTSAFAYKGKAMRVQDISQELGVRFVLEGTVQKAANRVRVTAQLVDATTGGHLWAERYDRPMNDIFVLQDEIVRRIVTTLSLRLDLWESGISADNRETDNLDAYDCYLRGLEYSWSRKRQGYFKARQMFEKAVVLDPKYAAAYKELTWNHLPGWVLQWDPDPHGLDLAFDLGRQAIALNDSLASAHTALGLVYLYKRQYEQAVSEAERSVDLDQNSAYGYGWLSYILSFSGRLAEAIAPAEKAIRLDPGRREFYLFYEGLAYVFIGRSGDAVDPLKRHVQSFPNLAQTSG